MRRAKYITRKVTAEKITVLMATTDGETYETEISYPRCFKNQRERERYISENLNTETEKFVCVKNIEIVSGIYGITETDFMQNAVKLSDER